MTTRRVGPEISVVPLGTAVFRPAFRLSKGVLAVYFLGNLRRTLSFTAGTDVDPAVPLPTNVRCRASRDGLWHSLCHSFGGNLAQAGNPAHMGLARGCQTL